MVRWVRENTLAFILLVSVIVRVAAALYLGDQVEILPGTHDQLSYDALAQNVAAGKGFVFDRPWYPFTRADTPTAHWSFLYVIYVAGVYLLAGYHPLAARLVQAVVVGLLMPWLVYRLGKRTFNRQVGLAGAAAVSLYIYLVYYGATLMTEPFYITALLWALDVLQRIAGRDDLDRRQWIELGIALGVATLLRQQVLLLVPLMLGWLAWVTRDRVRFIQLGFSALMTLLIVSLFILPWTVRNYRVFGSFLPLNSNVGYALYAANHPQQGSKFEPLNLPPLPAGLEGKNEAEINAILTRKGIQFVLDDPGRYALQTLDRFRNYFRFWPEPTSSTIANVSRVLSFGLYLPFMVYGLWRSGEQLRENGRGPIERGRVVLLLLFAAAYASIHLLSWAMHRYRLPVDAVMMVFVGLSLTDLAGRLAKRVADRRPVAGP